MRLHRSIQALFIALALCFVAQSASAQSENLSPEERLTARRLYDEATAAYDLGQYQNALDRWQEAYEITNASILLYSIANAHERLGNLEQAIESLKGYQTSVRDASEREVVEMRIHNLEERLYAHRQAEQLRREALERERADAEAREEALRKEQERLAQELNADRLRELRADPTGLVIARWGTISLAGAALVNGAVFQILAAVSTENLQGRCQRVERGSNEFFCPEDARDRVDTRSTQQNIATYSFIAGGVLAAAGVTMLFIHPNKNRQLDELSLQPVFYGDGGGLRLDARF